MMHKEFERIAGIEVTDEIYKEIEKMYMATNLDKYAFIKMLNLEAIAKEPEREIVTIRKGIDEFGNIIVFDAEYIGFDIATGKNIVKRISKDRKDCTYTWFTEWCVVKR